MTCCCLPSYRDRCHVPSFPTRRSSDLVIIGKSTVAVGTSRDLSDVVTRRGETGEDVGKVAAGTPSSCARVTPSRTDRNSTRLNSSHGYSSYAVFCLKNENFVARAAFMP